MDAAAHYRHLLSLGRDEFLAAAAPAVLVRHRVDEPDAAATGAQTLTMDIADGDDGVESVTGHSAHDPGGDPASDTLPHRKFTPEAAELELYPLAKKPGASFPDRITIGRTANNDVAIADPSVSRLHAYVRLAPPARWVVADAGSKNGSWLADAALEPRREMALPPGSVIRLGDVVLTFYRSEDLFDLLGDDHDRR